MAEHCDKCGEFTRKGRREWEDECAQRAREHPIFETDMTLKKSEVIKLARQKIYEARGILDDFAAAYPGWKGRVDHVNGLATCGLVALYATIQELEQHERKWEENNGRAIL